MKTIKTRRGPGRPKDGGTPRAYSAKGSVEGQWLILRWRNGMDSNHRPYGGTNPLLCRLSYRSMVTMPAITGFCVDLRTAVVSAFCLPGLSPGVGAAPQNRTVREASRVQAPIPICRIEQASLAHRPWEEASASRRPIRESARAYSTGGESLCPAFRRVEADAGFEPAVQVKVLREKRCIGKKTHQKTEVHAAVCLAPEPILHRLPRSGAFAPEDHFREVTKMVSPSFPHRLRRASFPPRQA